MRQYRHSAGDAAAMPVQHAHHRATSTFGLNMLFGLKQVPEQQQAAEPQEQARPPAHAQPSLHQQGCSGGAWSHRQQLQQQWPEPGSCHQESPSPESRPCQPAPRAGGWQQPVDCADGWPEPVKPPPPEQPGVHLQHPGPAAPVMGVPVPGQVLDRQHQLLLQRASEMQRSAAAPSAPPAHLQVAPTPSPPLHVIAVPCQKMCVAPAAAAGRQGAVRRSCP